MRWRPYYWNDLGENWLYRATTTCAHACLAFVFVASLALLAWAVIDAL